MSDRVHLMEVEAKAGGYRKSPKNPPHPYRASSHKYRVHGIREDLAGIHKAERFEWYTDSVHGFELGLDTYADYWKRIYSGFYVAMTGGFMSTLYLDRIY